MLDFDRTNRLLGFSTGALELGDYAKAVGWLAHTPTNAVELSALRLSELEPLIDHLSDLELNQFQYVSFHAPSAFDKSSEAEVIGYLNRILERRWNIVVHPDVIYTSSLWRHFGSNLLIENMDRRKPIGRTPEELTHLFDELPDAMLCLDLAHARQMDTTLTLLFQIIRRFRSRIRQIHISELDSRCRHFRLSAPAIFDYQKIADLLDPSTPVIIESMLDKESGDGRLEELDAVEAALTPRASTSSHMVAA